MEIQVPKPNMTDFERAEFATEVAFNMLLAQAERVGLEVTPCHLMYLPSQKMAQDFKQACRAILMGLTPAASHVKGSDGKDYWLGDGNVAGE